MSATLDGQKLFDKQDLKIEPGSVSRDSTERTVSGLDGVLSIDLGRRSREIKQRGVLRAKSKSQMNERISTISAYIDGNTHTLATSNEEEFDNLRMDVFKVTNKRVSGGGFCCDYEIIYTQLVV
jgi:hypothetical protein